MKHQVIEEFEKTTNRTAKTIGRFYKKYPALKKETIKNGRKPRKYPTSHAKYFSMENMIKEYNIAEGEVKCMQNVLDKLYVNDSIPTTMWYRRWTFFVTVAYRQERNRNSCRRRMDTCFKLLNKKYGNRTKIEMFYNTEPHTNRKSFHNHFVIYIENQALHQKVVKDLNLFFKSDRVDCQKYDKYKGAVYYTAKHGLQGINWDFHKNY